MRDWCPPFSESCLIFSGRELNDENFAGEVQKHAFLNSALDLNGQLNFAATIGHEENTLHSKDRNVCPCVGLNAV